MSDNLSCQHSHYLHLIKQLKLFDDDFMTLALRDKNCVELILSIILQRSIRIDNVYTQDVMKNLIGRSGILDIVAIDTLGVLYNLDVQNNNEGQHPKRLRYHGSLMDIHFTDVNISWKDIPRQDMYTPSKNPVKSRKIGTRTPSSTPFCTPNFLKVPDMTVLF